jgi:hypothetical protein
MKEQITEEWLKEVGFKWHQLERQPNKQWLLWLGDTVLDANGKRPLFHSYEDLGIEVGEWSATEWHCFLRADGSGRYSRFIHIRTIRYQEDLIKMIEGLTGIEWNPANNLYGAMRTPEQAAHLREKDKRLDQQIVKSRPWRKAIETDDSMGGALPEHLEGYIENDLAKVKK